MEKSHDTIHLDLSSELSLDNLETLNYSKNEKSNNKPALKILLNEVISNIEMLKREETRNEALYFLSRNRENIPDLALYLWHGTGNVAILLQEILSTYNAMYNKGFSSKRSNRCCNVLALFQTISLHPETGLLLIKSMLH